jgi:hypothetical protein
MFSAWFGGARPALFALTLALPAFVYYFVAPLFSFGVNIREIPRLLIFRLSAREPAAHLPVAVLHPPLNGRLDCAPRGCRVR